MKKKLTSTEVQGYSSHYSSKSSCTKKNQINQHFLQSFRKPHMPQEIGLFNFKETIMKKIKWFLNNSPNNQVILLAIIKSVTLDRTLMKTDIDIQKKLFTIDKAQNHRTNALD